MPIIASLSLFNPFPSLFISLHSLHSSSESSYPSPRYKLSISINISIQRTIIVIIMSLLSQPFAISEMSGIHIIHKLQEKLSTMKPNTG